ncbi:MAG: AAA family ATPase [Saprospiraceae bacterium]|nr:AAA family ATPase [Saprospiraceae bacterium]
MNTLPKIPGFESFEILNNSATYYLFRAIKKPENIPVILKVLHNSVFKETGQAYFYREHKVLSKFNQEHYFPITECYFDSAFTYSVYKDFKGDNLYKLFENRPLEYLGFLKLAVNICQLIQVIHNNSVVQKNLCPQNIYYDPESEQLHFLDFALSSELDLEQSVIQQSELWQTNIKYISPEQTGRMKRIVDQRSDIYSLGLIFYFLVTGQNPFAFNEHHEIIYAHLTKDPDRSLLNKLNVPELIIEIIYKMISKMPEERYQSISGLLYDLKLLSEPSDQQNFSSEIVLGQRDNQLRFLKSDKLYGRKEESERLKEIFYQLLEGRSTALFLKGNNGSGKTSFLRELFKRGIQYKSYFIVGKYELLKRNIPFYGLRQAFKELVQLVAGESEIKLNQIRKQLNDSLGLNLDLMINLVPDLGKILERKNESVELSLAAAENRLIFAIKEFIKVFANKDHPIVLFLDDVQWSDEASIKLLSELIGKIPYFMPIISYHDEEISADLRFESFLKLAFQNGNNHLITLKNLSISDVTEMLHDFFIWDNEQCKKIALIVHSKTDGNPYFIKQFIRTAYDKKFLYYDAKAELWQVDEKKLLLEKASGNVLNVLSSRYDSLDSLTKELIQLAACIGYKFDVVTLSHYKSQTAKEILQILKPAIDSELIVPVNDQYLLISDEKDFGAEFKFQSNGIVHKILETIDQNERFQYHGFIAEEKIKRFHGVEFEENILEIADQLLSSKLVHVKPEEYPQIIFLYSEAAIKAQSSIAYQSAVSYYQAAINLLAENHWQHNYSLSYNLYFGLAQNAYQIGQIELAEDSINLLLHHSANKLDHVKVLSMRLRQYTTLGRAEEAITQGIKGLKLLGIYLTEDPGQFPVLVEVLKVKWKLRGKVISRLLDLPVMQDEEMRLAARLLTEIGPAAYILGRDNLYAISSLKTVNLSITYGNYGESSFAYTAYGAVLGEVFNDYSACESFGKLAVDLNTKLDNHEFRCRVIAAYGVLMHHFRYHWKDMTEWYKKGIDAGFESGDLFFLAYCATNQFAWNPNTSLQQSIELQRGQMQLIQDTHFQDAINSAQIILQHTLHSAGLTHSPGSFNDDQFDEDALLFQMKARKYSSGIGMFYIAKVESFFILQDYNKALKFIKLADNYRKSLIGLINITKLNIFSFYTYASLYSSSSKVTKWKFKRKMKSILNKMSLWAQFNPVNFEHHYELMLAEWKLINNEKSNSYKHFQNSILLSEKNDYQRDQALALLRFSDFLSSSDSEILSIPYLKDAKSIYQRLGYKHNIDQIDSRLKNLQDKFPEISIFKGDNREKKEQTSINIDMESLIKASLALAGEIKLDALTEKILQIIIMNSGADYGALYLITHNKLKPLAWSEGESVKLIDHSQEASNDLAPLSVLNYVSHMKQALVLDDAGKNETFLNDIYFQANRTRSVLCAPVIHLGNLYAIIYLENNKMSSAFTEERLAMVNLLSTQIAISLQNALLYSNLEEKVSSRTQELSNSYNQLKETQTQLIHSEKMASLGELTAGIAHEIQNPLNFINNFSELNLELVEELTNAIKTQDNDLIEELTQNLHENSIKVVSHGKRAESIVKGMLQHSRKSTNQKELTDINVLADELIRLSYHGMRAKNKSFNASFKTNFTTDLPKINVIGQDIGRVLLNLLNNAFYAVDQKTSLNIEGYSPIVEINTFEVNSYLVIEIKDNGLGIAENIRQKIFQPFFTTKPTGQGTGLGLSLSYDIITKGHNGKIELNSKEYDNKNPLESYTSFHIQLPLNT